MRNKEMKLQLFAQTWNPDNVTVFEHKEGTIPDKYNELILKDVMEGSKVMQLAKYCLLYTSSLEDAEVRKN